MTALRQWLLGVACTALMLAAADGPECLCCIDVQPGDSYVFSRG